MNAITFLVVTAFGGVVLVLAMLGLDALGAPGWVVALPWLVPTALVLTWALWRPQPADRTDDDQGWVDFTIRRVLVGEHDPRSRPARAITGVVFGGPIGVTLLIGLLAELTGIV